ncbi:MAG: FAD:protein FMN transferase [Gammaproteobacteria bacterium]|nr:FAD:protein FMN transferase [Gammaproteobacteria bacterium]MCP4088345.1 FAD:protein FMN transferase [Gammaproteobacteria bacterium]MCP4275443.1 FAD:protein FMN transferase [Gammaproteobacteria bacterium]MCP4830991.1 FAD:protein FMN transferase [Gammaproteobacteria bacterium]MCP4927488.1 FAD:protein FMN transferase [Gammaproteobacteria bacterium]
MSNKILTLYRIATATLGLILLATAAHLVRNLPESQLGATAIPGDPAAGSLVETMRPLMGTEFAITVWAAAGREPAASKLIAEVFADITELEQQISSWLPNSETSKVNAAAGQAPVTISPELHELLTISIRWARRTEGAFDMTGGPLYELWGEARKQNTLPSAEAIQSVMPVVGYQKVELTDDTVRLPTAEMKLGFGSVGKGYAADRAAEKLLAAGFTNFIIDAGGDLVVSGQRGNTPWSVGIRHPRSNELLATTELTDMAIATSGDYEQYLIADGKRLGHIIDPRNGWPVETVASVVVIAEKGADADALATGLFVLGPDKGLALTEKISSAEALFMMGNGVIHHSEGLTIKDGVLEHTP